MKAKSEVEAERWKQVEGGVPPQCSFQAALEYGSLWEPKEPTTKEITLGKKRYLVSCVSLKDNRTVITEVKP